MKIKSLVAALALMPVLAHANGVIATFQTFDESAYGYGVDGHSTLNLWDDPAMCTKPGATKYTVTDNSTGAVSSYGCWYSEQEQYGGFTVILDGLGSLPGYLFRTTEYSRMLHEGSK